MSAFVVAKRHIDVLVNTVFHGPYGHRRNWSFPQYPPVQGSTKTQLGALLWAENVKSVNYRYEEHNEPRTYFYALQPLAGITAVEAIKAIHCYTYQSCEHPEWDTSLVKGVCDDLLQALTHCLPGYDEAPWEWTD